MSINYLHLKQDFFEKMEKSLSPKGFKRQGKQEKFIRQNGDRTESFLLICRDGKPGWWIIPEVAIRYESVEKIFHETSGIEKKYHKGTYTVGAPVGEVLGENSTSCQFFIDAESNVDLIVEQISKVFIDIAIPYYERWSNLQEIDQALNNNPTKAVHHLRGGLAWFRCSTGLIVAKLVSRPNYDELTEFYINKMTVDNNGFYLKKFQALVEYLNHG